MDEEISGLSTCGDGFVEDVRGWVCGWKREVNTGSEGYLGGGRGCGVWGVGADEEFSCISLEHGGGEIVELVTTERGWKKYRVAGV